MEHDLRSDRHRALLMALIRTHIGTAQPVGSKCLVEKGRLDMSPATARGLLSDLEKEGYLSQPHTSAGRVPTEKAYRYYVNTLLGGGLGGEGTQSERLSKALEDFSGGVDEFLRRTSRVLSDLSHYAGVVLPPRRGRGLFKKISFAGMGRDRVVAVLVSLSGVTTSKLVRTEDAYTQETLDRMSTYLNDRFSGMSLVEMKRAVERDLERDLENLNRWMLAALRLSSGLFDDPRGPEVYLEGGSRFLDLPEFFTDLDAMRSVFRTFEEKRGLVALLDETIKARKLTVLIGTETGMHEMKGMSLVLSGYGREEGALGVVGVIGPTRMDYSRVIPLVGSTARLVSRNVTGYV